MNFIPGTFGSALFKRGIKISETQPQGFTKKTKVLTTIPLNFILKKIKRDSFCDLQIVKEFPAVSLLGKINRSENYGGKPPVLNVTSLFMALGINSTRQ